MKYNDQLISEMINSKRLKLGYWDKISHYWIVILMLIGAGFFLLEATKSYLNKLEPVIHSSEKLFNIGFCFLVIAILFSSIQFRRLTFKKVIINFTESQYQHALAVTCKEIGWTVMDKSNLYVSAFHETHTYFNWGELITIIKIDNGILINSICDPSAKMALFSFGWNRKNRNAFIRNLESIVLE